LNPATVQTTLGGWKKRGAYNLSASGLPGKSWMIEQDIEKGQEIRIPLA
jgi:hypothetical protein